MQYSNEELSEVFEAEETEATETVVSVAHHT